MEVIIEKEIGKINFTNQIMKVQRRKQIWHTDKGDPTVLRFLFWQENGTINRTGKSNIQENFPEERIFALILKVPFCI